MNTFITLPATTGPPDNDLAEQARPGHGVPSQDPNPAAQVALDPEEAEREAKSVMTGGGMVGGAAIGATIGVVIAGPVGVVVGGTLGAVAGAMGGGAAGGMANSGRSSTTDPKVAEAAIASTGHHASAIEAKP